MSLSFAAFTFLNAWCLSLFMVAPFFVTAAKSSQKEDYAAAPAPMPWRRIIRINTLVALVITAGLALLIKSGIIPIRHTF